MAVYDATAKTGAVLFVTQCPTTEETWLQFTDAPGIYRKLRLMIFSERTMPAGYDGTIQVAVGFFTATNNDGETSARQQLQQLQSLVVTPSNADQD